MPWQRILSICLSREITWLSYSFRASYTKIHYRRPVSNAFLFAHCAAAPVRLKSRSTGGLDDYESKHLMKYADDLLLLLVDRCDPLEKDIKKWRNDLSGILFQYSKRNKESNLKTLFTRMVKSKQANEASYTIMMRHFADRNNFEQVKYYFEHMQENSVLYHGRSFLPLIVLCLRLQKYELATEYFESLLESTRKTFIHVAFTDLISACADMVSEKNKVKLNSFVETCLLTMEEYGCEPLDQVSTGALKKWFQRYYLL